MSDLVSPPPPNDEARPQAAPPQLLPRILLTGVIAGALVWFIGAAVFYGYVVGAHHGEYPGRWIQWFLAASEIGQALCLGSAAILVGFFVLRRWNVTRPR